MNSSDPRPAGHCEDDNAWQGFFPSYSVMTRKQLTHGHRSDFAAANAIFMADRCSLELIGEQTAAKERIRWLSVQLAIQMARADEAEWTNDLFIKAQERATRMWHDAGGDQMTMPDSAKLMVWLYEQVDRLTAENIRLAGELTQARLALPSGAIGPTELNPAVWEPDYDDGYPTDEWLATIATLQALPAVEGVKAARRFLVETLALATKGISCCSCDISDGKDYLDHPQKLIIFTTGGWSGAEDLMRAMLSVFWIKHHYVEWHAGGRHVFRVPVTDEVASDGRA